MTNQKPSKEPTSWIEELIASVPGPDINGGINLTDEEYKAFIRSPELEFFVPGRPAPQGSKRYIGHGRMLESSPHLASWRKRIAIAAHNAMRGRKLLTGPIAIRLSFVLPRPKQTPKNTPPAVKRPDIDKLVRAALDALTNTLYADDAQVITLTAVKRIAEPEETPGVNVSIWGTP